MKKINKLINALKNKKYKFEHQRFETSDDHNYPRGIKKILNLLSYTKTSSVSYSAGEFDSGYHSFKIDDFEFKGQRNPKQRFKDLPFSLKGLSVLDIGSNQGSMLYTFSKDIKYGVGIDYDSRMINVANKIKSYSNIHNVDYYVFNLEEENLDYIQDYLPENQVDLVFLLSICMWIKNWREVIDFSAKVSPKMVFESNGNPEQQDEQIAYLKKTYKNVDLINEKSEDDSSQKLRKLLYCY